MALIRQYVLQLNLGQSVRPIFAEARILTVYHTWLLQAPCHLHYTELHHMV